MHRNDGNLFAGIPVALSVEQLAPLHAGQGLPAGPSAMPIHSLNGAVRIGMNGPAARPSQPALRWGGRDAHPDIGR